MFVSPAPTSVVFRDRGGAQLPAAHRPASRSAAPAHLLFAPAVGAQVIPATPLQQHLDLPTPLFVHRDLPGEVGALVPAGGAEGRRGGRAGGEALQRAVVGGQVGRGGPLAVQLGALLLQRGPGGEDLDVIARVLPLRPLAFEPFGGRWRGGEKGEKKATGLFLFYGCPAGFSWHGTGSRGLGGGEQRGGIGTVVSQLLAPLV